MNELLQGPALFAAKASASTSARISLIVMLVAAVLLTVGWRLAVRKDFAAHRRVQTVAVCLNAIPVLAWMIRSFVKYILPGLPGDLNQRSYAVTTVHAVVGLIGVLLGVFILLRTSDLVPRRLRFTNYKLVMRTSYVIYMLATVGGIVVYLITYRVP